MVAGREATFKTSEGDVFFVRAGGEGDQRRLHNDGTASDVRIDRVPALPEACRTPTPDTPGDNFEVFTRTWAEHYILFDEKKTDWAAVVAENRAKVTDRTTPSELFDILEGMIRPFGDAHTSLRAPALDKTFRTLRPGSDRLLKDGYSTFRAKTMPALLAVTDRAYVKGPLRRWCNDQVHYGSLGDGRGYLRIVSFSEFAKGGGFAEGLAALESALDELFADPPSRGLVIDVRINFGGADPYGLAIAARLATGEYLAYTKEARADPSDRTRWTPGDPSLVRPSGRPGFRGPVVELIGPLTISAGETFTQALMGRSPRVVRVGENTQGVFSDVMGRHLPNGWSFGLPNEVFRTREGKTFDGPGIPPDVPVPVFADEDIARGADPGLEKALQLLESRK